MSKKSLDYSILCPNYYTNWEEGCCMETCTHNDLDLCPIHYVKGLLEDKDQQIKILQKALELACKDTGCMGCPLDSKDCDSLRGVEQGCSKAIHDYYITKAKEMVEE